MLGKFDDGAKRCPVCDSSLSAHETWPGARYRFCGSAACKAVVKDTKYWLYIESGEHQCEGPDCNNFVAEGRYDKKSDYYTCSGECWIRRRTKGNRQLFCGCGCGEEFLGQGQRKPIGGLYFKSAEHYGNYQHEQYVIKTAGVFYDLVTEYLEGFAKVHYREQQTTRKALGPFFTYLNEAGIKSIGDKDVTPRVITAFQAWGSKAGRRTVVRDISFISTFFKWALASEHRTGGNPVIPLIHSKRQPKRAPRPMNDDEIAFMWQLLNERGSPSLRLAAAIGGEAGLRIGEMARLRVQDIDLKRQRLFVRTPNKTDTEGWVFFSELTAKYFAEWMEIRDPDCGSDSLLLNARGNPSTKDSLAIEFRRTLCKTFRGKKVHDTGFDKWSTHRLRHTMATNLARAGADINVVMAQGRWTTAEAMSGYVDPDDELGRRGYDDAMQQSRNGKKKSSANRVLSLTEFLDRGRSSAQVD